ncbi:MAG: pilus assembly protein PilP [Deltaproteobacteria bacterium]|nr:pilus assembly protein PilP [Deltaproteobacteria bacterium]
MRAPRLSVCALLAALVASCGPAPRAGPAREPFSTPASAFDAPSPSAEAPADLYVYSPAGRRDPFRSPSAASPDPGPDASRPRGPLERHDLDQLCLEGIIWGLPRPLALIVTPDGVGHTVQAGTRLGKHGGRVEKVLSDRLVVAEDYRTAHMVRIIRRTPIRLRRD